MNLRNRSLRPVNPTSAKWSPDGRWLAVPVRDSAEKPIALWLVSSRAEKNGNSPDRLPAIWVTIIGTFSPDGRALAFVRYTAYRSGDLYVLPARRGSQCQRRTEAAHQGQSAMSMESPGPQTAARSSSLPTAAARRRCGEWPLRVARKLRRMGIGENGFFPSISRAGEPAGLQPID